MKTLCKRLVSMLLVFVLVLGLMPSVYAATDDGTSPTTKPTVAETTVPTETVAEETTQLKPEDGSADALSPTSVFRVRSGSAFPGAVSSEPGEVINDPYRNSRKQNVKSESGALIEISVLR